MGLNFSEVDLFHQQFCPDYLCPSEGESALSSGSEKGPSTMPNFCSRFTWLKYLHNLGYAVNCPCKQVFPLELELCKCRALVVQDDASCDLSQTTFWPHLCQQFNLLRPLFHTVRGWIEGRDECGQLISGR